jgi:DNA-binding CsgD family transcriptional regulator
MGTEMKTGKLLVPRSVGAAAEAALNARGGAREVERVLDERHVPIVMVDARRRFVAANRAARLALRLSLDEMRTLAVDDLASAEGIREIRQVWARLLDTGCVAGRYQVAGRDGSRLHIVYYGLAQVLSGLHLIVFAPADWPEHELDPIEDDLHHAAAPLTPREIDVLVLAADGHTGPALAHQLALSPATVNSHFKNIYEKLDVRTRAGAVAKAMRLGIID